MGLGDSTLLEGAQFRRPPIFDDGLIEVVGFGNGWQAAAAMMQVPGRCRGGAGLAGQRPPCMAVLHRGLVRAASPTHC